MYIASNNVEVFPLAKPRPDQRTSRLLYEENLTGIIRQVVDINSFIINNGNTPSLNINYVVDANNNVTSTIADVTLDSDLEFNIYGYYFKLKKGTSFKDLEDLLLRNNTLINNNIKYIVAQIKLTFNKDQTGIATPFEIAGQDVDFKYEGLSILPSTNTNITDTNSDDGTTYTMTKNLILFETKYKDGKVSGFTVYTPSYNRFDPTCLSITGIDGKN